MITIPDVDAWVGPKPNNSLHIQNPNIFPSLSCVDMSTCMSVEDFTNGLVCATGYDIARMRDGSPVILWNDEWENLRIVGAWNDALTVHEEHRGQGLGKVLVLAKALENPQYALPKGLEWTESGWHCAKSAYHLLVKWISMMRPEYGGVNHGL